MPILNTIPEHAAPTAVADTVVNMLSAALLQRAEASLVVPGGRSAMTILPLLTKTDIDWGRIKITLTDERWVPANHPDSNERLVRETLLNATGAQFIGLKTTAASPPEALQECETRLQNIVQPFDVVFVGMGNDGHIASLFPSSPIESGYFQAAQRPDHPRISMTPTCLLSSRHIILPISGNQKRTVFDRAMHPGPTSEYPVRHLLHQDQTPISVFLF